MTQPITRRRWRLAATAAAIAATCLGATASRSNHPAPHCPPPIKPTPSSWAGWWVRRRRQTG